MGVPSSVHHLRGSGFALSVSQAAVAERVVHRHAPDLERRRQAVQDVRQRVRRESVTDAAPSREAAPRGSAPRAGASAAAPSTASFFAGALEPASSAAAALAMASAQRRLRSRSTATPANRRGAEAQRGARRRPASRDHQRGHIPDVSKTKVARRRRSRPSPPKDVPLRKTITDISIDCTRWAANRQSSFVHPAGPRAGYGLTSHAVRV